MNTEKIVAGVAGGILLPAFEYFYGQGPVVVLAIVTVAFFILMDWISGKAASDKDNTYSSRYGINGVFRTFFMLLLPAGGHLLDTLFGSPSILFGILVFGLLRHTIKSMTANVIRAGWAEWVPVDVLEKITSWVSSELESKITRAAQRRQEREANVHANKKSE